MQISSPISALCTISDLAVNLLGQEKKKEEKNKDDCQTCDVVPGQSAPLIETGRLFPGNFRHNQHRAFHQSRPSVRHSAPRLHCAMKEGPLEHTVHRWCFTSSILPPHKEGRLRSLPHLYYDSLKVSHWPAVTLRPLTKCLILLRRASRILADANDRFLLLCATSGPETSSCLWPWAVCETAQSVTVTRCAPGATEEAVGKHRDKTQS